jgi:hypothetical protein
MWSKCEVHIAEAGRVRPAAELLPDLTSVGPTVITVVLGPGGPLACV